MADKEVVIYSTPTCPYCRRAKEFFKQKGIDFTDYNVAEDKEKEKAQEMIKKSGQMGVPVILIDGEIVIGFNQALVEKLLSQ